MVDGAPEKAEFAVDLHKDIIQMPAPLGIAAHVRDASPPEPDGLWLTSITRSARRNQSAIRAHAPNSARFTSNGNRSSRYPPNALQALEVAAAEAEPDHGDEPEGRGRGQADDRIAALQDRAAADEADAGQDAERIASTRPAGLMTQASP